MASSDYIIKLVTDVRESQKAVASFASFATAALATIGVGFSLSKAISEASQYEDAVQGLRTSLELSGITAKAATENFLEFADSLQRTTKFGDDAVITTGSLIQSIARLPSDQLERATKAALDLSTALRIDLNSAARLVGKAAEGNVEAFARYGVAIEKGKTNAETFANALNQLESRFGGASEKAVNTFAGATAQLSNAAGDAVKQFGLLITQNPQVIAAINNLAGQFIKLASAIERSAPIIEKVIGGLSEFLFDESGRQAAFREIEASMQSNTKAFKDNSAAVDEAIGWAKAYRTELGKQNLQVANQKIASEGRAKALAEAEKAAKALEQEFISLRGQFKTFDLDPVRAEITKTANYLKTLDAAREKGLVKDTEYEEIRLKIHQEGNKRLLEAQEKQILDAEKKAKELQNLAGFASSGIQLFIDNLKKVREEFGTEGTIVTGLGALASSVKSGAEGARIAVVSVLTEAAKAYLGPLGEALRPVFDALSLGPDAAKKMVLEFTNAVPEVVKNIILAIPAVLEAIQRNGPELTRMVIRMIPEVINAFIDQLPTLIESMVTEIPLIIQAIIEELPALILALINSIPRIVTAFIQSFINLLPNLIAPLGAVFAKSFINAVPAIVQSIADGVKEALKNIGGGVGDAAGGLFGGIGKAVGGIGKVFGFAEGGVVPGGAPYSDRIPALLTPGERVLTSKDRDEIASLRDEVRALRSETQKPMIHNVNLQMGLETFARLQFETSKRGFRVVGA